MMGRSRLLTDDDRAVLAAMYRDGVPLKQIEYETGRSRRSLYRTLKGEGIASCRRGTDCTGEDDKRLVELYLEGCPVKQIEWRAERSRQSLFRALRKMGLEPSRQKRGRTFPKD